MTIKNPPLNPNDPDLDVKLDNKLKIIRTICITLFCAPVFVFFVSKIIYLSTLDQLLEYGKTIIGVVLIWWSGYTSPRIKEFISKFI